MFKWLTEKYLICKINKLQKDSNDLDKRYFDKDNIEFFINHYGGFKNGIDISQITQVNRTIISTRKIKVS